MKSYHNKNGAFRTCRGCKTTFPAGKGHNIRTCNKINKKTPNPTLLKNSKTSVLKNTTNHKSSNLVSKKFFPETKKHTTEKPRPYHCEKITYDDSGKISIREKNGLSFDTELSGEITSTHNCVEDDEKRVWFNTQGVVHRVSGPAIEYISGTKVWYINGKQHRIDGPAVEGQDGSKVWWVDGKLHRENHPAVVWPDGHMEWWVNGGRHRTDGPAVERPNGSKEWWVDGKQHRIGAPAVINANGDEEWWVNGLLHREGGPAKIWKSGSEEWYKEGKLHREDGPARVSVALFGGKRWYKDGVLHRVDGPAVVMDSGFVGWWVNGYPMGDQADRPEIPEVMGEYFYLLCINENPNIRRKALANPNCPPQYKILGKITQS